MPNDSPVPPEQAYDQLAGSYTEEVEENPYNAHIVFPATTELLDDVDGMRFLDAGCGTGAYSDWLSQRGATVVGIDLSEQMLAVARRRVTTDAGWLRADLATTLPFVDDSFDGIVSVLAMSYVEDWYSLFDEFARVCRPGSTVVVSTTHPFNEFGAENEDAEDYFETEQCTKSWHVDIPYYRRPLSAMLQPLIDAGFSVESFVEPQPTDAFASRKPELYEKESRYPVFLCVRARLH